MEKVRKYTAQSRGLHKFGLCAKRDKKEGGIKGQVLFFVTWTLFYLLIQTILVQILSIGRSLDPIAMSVYPQNGSCWGNQSAASK